MRMSEIEERSSKLRENFSLLDEKGQEHITGILQALLYTKLKTDAEKVAENACVEGDGGN